MRVFAPELPVVNSEYLFLLLARRLKADLICDVGAFDCAHSRRFRSTGARVVAVEASPTNFAVLAADPSIAAAGIEIVNCAMWNTDGSVPFNVIQVREGPRINPVNPIGSIHVRAPEFAFEARSVPVRSVRLDSFIQKDLAADRVNIALWIDVEGAAYEVLQGMENIRSAVCTVHVEVETREFWLHQRLWADVAALMRNFGFTPLARRSGDVQVDVVFINNKWLDRAPILVRWLVLKAWMRLRASRLRQKLRQLG